MSALTTLWNECCLGRSVKRLYTPDQMIVAVHELVMHLPAPTDTPVTVASVGQLLGWSEEKIVAMLPALEDDGFLVSSPIAHPPLLYLTRTGLAFARRRQAAA